MNTTIAEITVSLERNKATLCEHKCSVNPLSNHLSTAAEAPPCNSGK
jgi:hypothetical protein